MPAPAISKPKPEPAKSAAYGHVCVDCAKAKVKCYPRPEGVCVRCHRRGQPCTPATPARRLGAKRASSATSPGRSSRLEGKLDHLVDLIRSQQAAQEAAVVGSSATQSPVQQQPPSAGAHIDRGQQPEAAAVYAPKYNYQAFPTSHNRQQHHSSLATPSATTAASPARGPESPAGPTPYENELTIMTPEQAEQCLQTFRSGYMKYLPYIYLPADVGAEQLRRDRPFLWLNIQGICARPPSKQMALGGFIREVLARQYMIEGERSLDLLLGTLTCLTWSHFYNRGRPMMTMMSHVARALTYDLRINKDFPDDALTGSVYAKIVEIPKPPLSHEVRRALLACYITSSVSTSFGRHAPLPWSRSMEEAAQQLRASPETPSDEMLVAIASARRLIDETSLLNKQQADDPAGFGIITAYIPALKAALQSERERLPSALRANRLMTSYFDHVEVCIHELALLQQPSDTYTSTKPGATTSAPGASQSTSSASAPKHQSAGSRPPAEPVERTSAETSSTTTTSMLVTARTNSRRLAYLTTCLDAAKRCLDNLLSLDAADFLYMTFSVTVQALYSLQTLNRLALVEGVDGWERTEVRSVADGLEYMGRLESKMRQAGRILREGSVRRFGCAANGSSIDGAEHPPPPAEQDGPWEESSFTKGAELLRKTAEAWGKVLNAKQQPVNGKSRERGLEIDFQCINVAEIGQQPRRGNDTREPVGRVLSHRHDPSRGGGASFDNILNHHDPAEDVVMGGNMVNQVGIGGVAGGVPLYSNNPYAPTTAGIMPDGTAVFGGMGDPILYPGVPDYSWMSDMLGYWEL
ncbi:uncharacterized protein B0I36DRAFT_163438 [Microdochium trichocladiopsis]|uniref:Zn(2)-C6 fungal-type domain-containing protein n=1 Tax=Microdochium trichocladiopsis TaxID=1682393 RepID=A0A9P8XZS2_9PEZI|nr:uncharacterized protein B0I36DRAFT_163438 [Microdochium trichocladiopsis]KAH7024643.1 hypothetical protein B0I36DRAFT_163438 [Microdochium trichocladiopsis]